MLGCFIHIGKTRLLDIGALCLRKTTRTILLGEEGGFLPVEPFLVLGSLLYSLGLLGSIHKCPPVQVLRKETQSFNLVECVIDDQCCQNDQNLYLLEISADIAGAPIFPNSLVTFWRSCILDMN